MGWCAYKYYDILCKGLEHPQVLVSAGVLESTSGSYWGTTVILNFWRWGGKYNSGFLQVHPILIYLCFLKIKNKNIFRPTFFKLAVLRLKQYRFYIKNLVQFFSSSFYFYFFNFNFPIKNIISILDVE